MTQSRDGSSDRPSVLLVEGNPGDARLAKEAFEETGFPETLHVVSKANEALDYVHQRGEYTGVRKPDLFLMDWHLPDRAGKELLLELKEGSNLKPIPVIVLTGSQSDRDIIEIYEEHANACIEKSTDPDELIDTVRVIEEFWLKHARLPRSDDEEEETGPLD